MPASPGNQFAAKPEALRRTKNLNIRCRSSEMDRWSYAAGLRAARDPKMKPQVSSWVSDVLNAEADYEIGLAKKAKPGR